MNLWGADSALYPLRGREIGFQATEDGRTASRRRERPRASAKENGSPTFPSRPKVGQRKRRQGGRQGRSEGWRKGGRETGGREGEELIDAQGSTAGTVHATSLTLTTGFKVDITPILQLS